MTTTLVLNAVCDRIIFFTQDPTYKPDPSPYTWVAYYEGELPAEMTTANCWSYRFRNNKLLYADKETPKPTALLERNRSTLTAELAKKVDSLASPYLPSSNLSGALRAKKLKLARIYVTSQESTDLIRLAKAKGQPPLDFANDIIAAYQISENALFELEAARLSLLDRINTAASFVELEQVRRDIADLKL